MHVSINGELRELDGPMTVGSLLKELRIDARRVAVELNRRILKRVELDKAAISDGDELEVVHFVGGGRQDSGYPGNSKPSITATSLERRAKKVQS